MKVSDWIIDHLVRAGTADAFGIPGAVALELLYAMDRRRPEFTPHLSYHEQGAAFAACGYAQATGRLGVAYTTRGPGFTNTMTALADAYYDSIPIIVLTAHGSAGRHPAGMRIENNQEIDTAALAAGITKYASRVDELEKVKEEVVKACSAAVSGRKGPVFLDILSSLLDKEIDAEPAPAVRKERSADAKIVAAEIAASIRGAKRPVFLVGSGIHQSGTQELIEELADGTGIPVLSSRIAQDAAPRAKMYYGYVGSHATRYSNFILAKADVIVALGNRMAFPLNSKSFRPCMENKQVIRVDVDESEFLRDIPNSTNYKADLRELLPLLVKEDLTYLNEGHWLSVCEELKRTLWQWDMTPPVRTIMRIMETAGADTTFVSDVGDHSFWVTNAYAYARAENRVLYSGAFGTLGCALPKAIGACCATGKKTVCFVGDQGFQMNIQELQCIAKERLPVAVVVINNFASAMIREREEKRYQGHLVHTTPDSGYGPADLEAAARAYKLPYRLIEDLEHDGLGWAEAQTYPCLIEVRVREDMPLRPSLPLGKVCQDLAPELPRELYDRLNDLT